MPVHSLMFGWEYPPFHTGGLGVACQGLVKGLLQNGVQVTLVLPMDVTKHPEAAYLRGPTSEVAPVIRFVPSALQPYEGLEAFEARMIREGKAAGPAVQDLYGPDLGEAVKRYAEMSVTMTHDVQPDVIHCHDWMTYEAGIRAKEYHQVPLVVHIHATEFDRTDFKPNQWIYDQERRGFHAADKIIAVSNYTKSLLVNHYGISPDKIEVVYNGHETKGPVSLTVDPMVCEKRKESPLVLFLGRLTVQKNPVQFLNVAKAIHEHRPDVQFVMAGEGNMLEELLDKTCELGLAENVIFTGKVSRKEADHLYKHASCFVMPSLSEPFGLVALEAISHGVPVVLSKQSGAAEVCDHAFKVDFWDTDYMADCILTILREDPLSEQLRSEAPDVLGRLTWENQAAEVQSVYHDTLSSSL